MTASELKDIRRNRSLTQQELADQLRVKKRTVVAWENEQNPVPPWVEEKLSGSSLKLSPKLTYEQFRRAEIHADSQDKTMDEWVAALMAQEAAKPLPASITQTPKKGRSEAKGKK